MNPTSICVPLCESSYEALKEASGQASKIGDLLELRLDCLESIDLTQISNLVRELNKAVILTYPSAADASTQRPDLEEVDGLLKLGAELRDKIFLDFGLDVVNALMTQPKTSSQPLDWSQIICSHHDFNGFPANLDQIYCQLAGTSARVIKIAVQANDITDCIAVFKLLDRARSENRQIIAIAMGGAGIPTRILGPSRDAFLTFGSRAKGRSTAPGQITAADLRELYHIESITQDTHIFGLAGSLVSHSLSPSIHNAAFQTSGFDGVYLPFEVHNIGSFMRRMVHPRTSELDLNIRGISVTAPHKSSVMEFLDWTDSAAKDIGAVNTIVVDDEGLRGYNTDAPAFLKTLKARVDDLRDVRCAVIGAGGAASAVLWVLRDAQADVTVFARNVLKASQVAQRFGADCKAIDSASFKGFDVLINATPLGTAGKYENESPVISQQLAGTRLAYDLVYNPAETKFLREARAAGCDVAGGLEMLVTQAVEQFRLWTGEEAPEKTMMEAAITALKSASHDE